MAEVAPVLHNITEERVAFVYNANSSDSLEVAEYYRDARNLPNANLIGLNIPAPVQGSTGLVCESVILNEADYVYLIENPLIEAIQNIASLATDGSRTIWVIILGFGIPVSFDNNGEIIAIASRLHKLGISSTNKISNHTFDRRTFQFFDDQDATQVYITAVLDGPTAAAVKKLIDRSIDVDNQTFITGDLFIDPYGQKVNSDDLAYQENILDFISNEVPNLGIESNLTVDINVEDPYQEPTVLQLFHDAFYWGWFNPTYSNQLLLSQNERRVFLYNADDRAACNIHYYQNSSPFDSNGSDHWCNIAINAEPGYAACAGAVADPGSDSFLQPLPFFQTLHQGATLGEAFLFASKYLNWKTILIGDPLMVVNFPVDLPSDQDTASVVVQNDEIILRLKYTIEESLGWAARQARLLDDLRDRVVETSILAEELHLLQPLVNWRTLKELEAQRNLYSFLVSRWMTYIELTTNLTLSQWLTENDEKITSELQTVAAATSGESIADAFVYSTGYWELIFTFTHTELTFENVFFKLEISRDSDFETIALTVNSLTDATGWSYESQLYSFTQIPDDGLPSNFSGRRVRYSSPQSNFLRSTEVYYTRWVTLNDVGIEFSGTSDSRRIIVSS
jgi:uncharacterized protein (TIGR03790 family)